ncbi:MAG: acyl-CoA/acyl-ACP dehydrogenase, partial [Actinobacteria bacterium]|nr:acyl-CoA/acyl-ACP dehydrogenase [Actinomycetota bacterium]
FAFTEEQDLLRQTARRFLTSKAGTDVVRRLMETEDGFDEGLWNETVQMGWQAMAIPEEYGGAGYGFVELSVLMEEMGRAVFAGPFLSSAVLAAQAILLGGTEEQKKAHLPAIAAGEERYAFAHLEGRDLGPSGVQLRATRGGDGWTLSGTKSYVLDGHTAARLVVAARTGDDADAVGLFLVDGDADGLTRTALPTMDETRKQAELRFADVSVGADALLGDATSAWPVVEQVVTRGSVALACEQVGGAQAVLEMATDYAKTRYQFGRAIGSYQAIKHKLAEMLVDVEAAKSAAYHAARAVAAGDEDEIAIAAPLAKSYCSEVFEHAAGDNIQVHGGIGFTWEHDAHLWFKRAKTSTILFGDPAHHRAKLADVLGF